jgi:hypothetical protein
MPDPELPEYAISYSKDARVIRDGLTEPLRLALLKIEDELTDNPDKYPTRLIRLSDELFIYKHPDPAIEITCHIDRGNKILCVLHVVAPTLTVNKTLFISYSHEDEEWFFELKKWIKPLEMHDIVRIWDDTKIKASADWRQEIEGALSSAKAAILLVSVDFLNSDFIANNELPQLLDAARDKGLKLFWIAVRPSYVDETGIVKYQAAHKEPPLALMEKAEREQCLQRIYEKIKEALAA